MKQIVMTGATSGIGRVAAKRLVAHGHRVIAGARGAGSPDGVEVRALDLNDLDTVRTFAASLADSPIEGLILNAGMQAYDVSARTAQGFEQTFAVNHLAHYLLARLLIKQIVDGGTLILTSSGTHDPAEKTGVPPPRHANATWLANPDLDPQKDVRPMTAGLRAYASSKLCNLMTARRLSDLSDTKARDVSVMAYDPGLTPGTGLARATPFFVRTIVWPLLPLVRPFVKGMNSLADAGACLADLGEGKIDGDAATYCALRKGKPTWPAPSDLARDDAACAKLWADSADMVGLPR
jgi:NAD(P)-dependent dehydrogenase (short-subunit alcohol dehydrogenase family)